MKPGKIIGAEAFIGERGGSGGGGSVLRFRSDDGLERVKRVVFFELVVGKRYPQPEHVCGANGGHAA